MLHINNLIDLPSVASSSAKNLRPFISLCHENIQAHLALKHYMKKNYFILSAILLRKQGAGIRKTFEDGRADSKKVPDIQ